MRPEEYNVVQLLTYGISFLYFSQFSDYYNKLFMK